MKYQKEPTADQIKTLLDALRFAMKNGNDFMVIADLGENGVSAGSGRMSLVEFLVNCMMANGETAELFINVVMNFLSNKILQDVCGNCDKSEACRKKQSSCDPENLYSDIQAQLELALKRTKSSMN